VANLDRKRHRRQSWAMVGAQTLGKIETLSGGQARMDGQVGNSI
jgi:hypothetical protein